VRLYFYGSSFMGLMYNGGHEATGKGGVYLEYSGIFWLIAHKRELRRLFREFHRERKCLDRS
jgi:hypothetical protein